MAMHLSTAPCCWGVDDIGNPFLPPWTRVLDEASQAGYHGLELGPFGYMPLEAEVLGDALQQRRLRIVAGTVFDDLLTPANLASLLDQAHQICALLRRLPAIPMEQGQRYGAPYLVVMDWGHEERDYAAGHSDRAPRLARSQWQAMMDHISQIAELAWREYGVRAVVHPHAGGYIEFADELAQLVRDIPYETAGLCLDTGHLYYAGMDPVATLRQYARQTDYLHFKDIDRAIFEQVMGERIRFFDACGKGVMCPIGRGVIDYPAIAALLAELGYQGHITIEQERDPRNAHGSLEDVAASRRFLDAAGFVSNPGAAV